MKLRQIMSSNVQSVTPGTRVDEAARIMRETNVGCLPVVRHRKLVGLITDRDIVVRVVGDGRDTDSTQIADIMTRSPRRLNEDTHIDRAVALMRDERIRRIPVVDDGGFLTGIVTLTDIALRAHEPIQSGITLACISAEPALVG